MVTKVNTSPLLPQPPGLPELFALARFDQDLVQALVREMVQYAYRLNLALPEDGSEAMSAPLPLAVYVKASLPAQQNGAIIFVNDDVGGKTVAYSDGTNWRRVKDGNVIS